MSNSMDLDQARYSVRPDLGPNFLKRLSDDDTSRKVKRSQVGISKSQCISDVNIVLYLSKQCRP